MPELPEVELARQVLAGALGRKIREVDDHDDWVCRPHAPGDLAAALRGGRLTEAHRRGKTLWCETEGGDVLDVVEAPQRTTVDLVIHRTEAAGAPQVSLTLTLDRAEWQQFVSIDVIEEPARTLRRADDSEDVVH